MWHILISKERNSYNKRKKKKLSVDVAFICQLSAELAVEIKTS